MSGVGNRPVPGLRRGISAWPPALTRYSFVS